MKKYFKGAKENKKCNFKKSQFLVPISVNHISSGAVDELRRSIGDSQFRYQIEVVYLLLKTLESLSYHLGAEPLVNLKLTFQNGR